MKPDLAYYLCVFLFSSINAQSNFHVIRQWKYVNFTWPSEEIYKAAVSKGMYIPDNNIIAGIKYFEDHFYITLPRMKSGVPATLTRIKAGNPGDPSPKLEPFPSWEMNGIENCNNLQNVQNIEIDTKGQMWIIDGGRINTLQGPMSKCAPKLVIFDLKNNRSTTIYNFPDEVAAKNGSFLYDIVVDDTDAGYAYITDNSVSDPGIIVYSVKENRSWKIRHQASMTADPTAIHFNVNEITVSAPINIAGIALGPKIHTNNDKLVVNEEREVYFSPLSSLHLFSINTTILQNEDLVQHLNNNTRDILDLGLKSSQSASMIMDNRGVLYYSLLGETAIGRWDSQTPFHSGQKLIARDNRFIEWPSSFAFDLNGNLTIVMNSLNKFIYGKLDLNEYNFRLISSDVGGKSYLFDTDFNYHPNENGHGIYPNPNPQPEPNFIHYNHSQMNESSSPHGQMSSTTQSPMTTPSGAKSNVIKLGFAFVGYLALYAL